MSIATIQRLCIVGVIFASLNVFSVRTKAQVPVTPGGIPCDCRGWSANGVDILSVVPPGTPPKKASVKCNNKVQLKKGKYSMSSPTYICFPASCMPTYSWTVTGTLSGTGSGKVFIFNFSQVGSYNVTIVPRCGTKYCPPCTFNIVTTP